MDTKKVNVQMLEPQPTNGIRTIDTTSSQTIAKPNVMRRYFYKDGTEVKDGDICYYSEYNGVNNEFHYADSISVMERRLYDIFPKAKVITMTNARSFIDYDEPNHNTVSLEYGSKDGVVQDFIKIGVLGQDDYMITKEYAINNYAVT